jgi:hypothetical protein
MVEQRISGPCREPEVEQTGFLVTIAEPLHDLLERGVQLTGQLAGLSPAS